MLYKYFNFHFFPSYQDVSFLHFMLISFLFLFLDVLNVFCFFLCTYRIVILNVNEKKKCHFILAFGSLLIIMAFSHPSDTLRAYSCHFKMETHPQITFLISAPKKIRYSSLKKWNLMRQCLLFLMSRNCEQPTMAPFFSEWFYYNS